MRQIRPMSNAPVPFLDLGKVNARWGAGMAAAMDEVVRSHRYLMGDANHRFASEYAQYTGTEHCVPLANGLDALRLTLKAWITLGRLAPGDEVIVPANSFIASALAVSDSGLTLRFADVDEVSFGLTEATVRSRLTARTRAVMPVHLYGRVSPHTIALQALCAEHGMLLIEDAAQAHGARLGGRAAGSFGDAAGFSFYPSKNLGALGDAGCMVTRDPVLADRVRMLGNYGSVRKYEHEHLGVNSRMDELQAAVLRLKLRTLDADNARRRQIADAYDTQITHPLVTRPALPPDPASHVWHLYVIQVDDRAGLAEHLRQQGIETMIHYPAAIHRQAPYRAAFAGDRHPVAERLQDRVLSLPISPVMSDDQTQRVAGAINAWRRGTDR